MPRLPNNINFKSMTALVVDDQFTIRKAVCRILTNLGFNKVLDAPHGDAAMKLLNSSLVDLVITDLFMPGSDGFETLKRIRNLNFGADIPVIVVTGEGDRGEIVKASDLGADDYILKPFQVEDLERKVWAVLSRYLTPPPLLRLLREGDKLYLLGHYEDALKCFEAAERLAPDSARAKFSKALTLKQLGFRDQALDILKISSEKSPAFYKSFGAIADLSIERGDTQAAIDALVHELDLNPKQHDRQVVLADLLERSDDLDGALNHFQAALIENPKSKKALLGAARTLGALAKTKQALSVLRRARRYYPTWTEPLNVAKIILSEHGKRDEALTFLHDEIRRHPDRDDARILLANFRKDEDLPAALKILDDGLSRVADSVPLLKAKSSLLKDNHQLDAACQLYKKVLKLEPSLTNELQLARYLMEDRQFQAAFDLLERHLHEHYDGLEHFFIMIEALRNLARPVQALHVVNAARAVVSGDLTEAVNDRLKTYELELKKYREHHAKIDHTKKKAS